ncbi:unnamed protein product, partial [Haemonchus placei]|uniref:CUB domain-containing protein n=1 Tax=Haemonchus placei TaxID=6290 RepID=A0A0N4WF59_HAEPC
PDWTIAFPTGTRQLVLIEIITNDFDQECLKVFFSMVLLIQSPDLLTMNGTYFYFLGLFDGGGGALFTLHVISKTLRLLI